MALGGFQINTPVPGFLEKRFGVGEGGGGVTTWSQRGS